MSRKNVEVAYSAYEALQQGDIEGFLGYCDPDIEFQSLRTGMEGAVHGHDGIRKWWSGLVEAFPDWKATIVEVRDLDGRVLIHSRGRGTGAGSGLDIDVDSWQLAEPRNGRVYRLASFFTEEEALEAAGLSE